MTKRFVMKEIWKRKFRKKQKLFLFCERVLKKTFLEGIINQPKKKGIVLGEGK